LNRRVGGPQVFLKRKKFPVPTRNQTPDYLACSLVTIKQNTGKKYVLLNSKNLVFGHGKSSYKGKV
jgi:hypothetical protein